MEAVPARQSKTEHTTGEQNPAPKRVDAPIAAASLRSGDTAGSAIQSRPPSPDTSVSWPRTPGTWIRIIAALTGGLILRLWMMSAFPQTGGDALIYSNIARNILQYGQYALTDGSGVLHATLIRLPGYPLFLALCFRLFGVDSLRAIAAIQITLELASCLLLADFGRRIWTPRAGFNTLWLAALCPFTALYAGAPLSESLTFDCICLALWSLAAWSRDQSLGRPNRNTGQTGGSRSLQAPEMLVRKVQGFSPGGIAALALFTLAISAAALLRPDGALLAFALWPALLFRRRKSHSWQFTLHTSHFTLPLLVALLSILPFAVWTARNWSTFHVVEPLAPRYATDPGEDPHLGWQHWVKTWCLDFTCTDQVYWNVPDDTFDFADLPARAFDSPEQKAATEALVADYNRDPQLAPAMDARFEALAQQRAAAHPMRIHLILPLGRLADMLFRPRVESLTIDLKWWEYWNHKPETRFSVAYGLLNLIMVGLGLYGFRYRPRLWGCMAAYLILRSLLLMTIEAPETRYTLEFFPMLFAQGGITLQQLFMRKAHTPGKLA